MKLRHRAALGLHIAAAIALFNFAAPAAAAEAEATDVHSLDAVVVTGTREAEKKSETAATIDTIDGEEVRRAKAAHPSQIMSRVPGVWVSVTGGEGHTTSIRHPLTTAPVYLYLEDGIPVRSTGFFNHNALYEVNMPQSGGIEVSKGPGTALYGSDAIGGVVNVLTRPAPEKLEGEGSLEFGSFGWRRLLLSGGNGWESGGVRGDLNLTHTNGWRDATAYDRQSATVRVDEAVGATGMLKIVATGSKIDQKTAGTSTLSVADYYLHPTKSYTPISLRKVNAFRLSAAYDREEGNSLFSLTPYYRNDSMDLLANWSLGYDPTIYNTQNQSYGIMAKYRMDFDALRTRLILGVDADRSPGGRTENSILTTNVGAGVTRQYVAYSNGARIYDYKVTYRGVSPYLHGEFSPSERVRITAGLRYDSMGYDYSNNLGTAPITVATSVGNKTYAHAGSRKVDYRHLSPKIGFTWQAADSLNLFAAYNHAFRTPSEGQVFRPAATTAALAATVASSALHLKPVKVDSYEVGLRGDALGLGYELSLYRMTKRDDVVSYRDPLTLATTVTNAGRTDHRGMEIGIKAPLADTLRLDLAYSHAIHRYQNWNVVVGGVNRNLSGKEMESAPRRVANARLLWKPTLLAGGDLSLEAMQIGGYWLDQANTQQYSGHTLVNLGANLPVAGDLALFANVRNLTDRRYADSAALSAGTPVLAPGNPRTFFAGLNYGM